MTGFIEHLTHPISQKSDISATHPHLLMHITERIIPPSPHYPHPPNPPRPGGSFNPTPKKSGQKQEDGDISHSKTRASNLQDLNPLYSTEQDTRLGSSLLRALLELLPYCKSFSSMGEERVRERVMGDEKGRKEVRWRISSSRGGA